MSTRSTDAPVRVLVVDDDPALLGTLKDILGLHGYEVVAVQEGRAGLKLLLEEPDPPLVALVDLGLPDIHGLDLAAELKKRGSNTQIVILTGDASVDSLIGAVRADTVDYLVKPVQPPRLLETIGRASERGLRRSVEAALERERKLKSDILDASPVGIAVLTPAGDVTYLNRAASSMLGRGAASDESAARSWLAECLRDMRSEDGYDTRSVDRRYVRPDGRVLMLSCRMSPLEAPDGSVDGVLHVFTDITARHQLEEGLRQAQKMEAVGRLAGGVSHDFNNLLTVILGNTELLLADFPGASSHREDMEVIREAARQASDVAEQLLTFSRQSVGRAERVDLNEILRSASGLLARTAGSGTEVRHELDESLPTVEADPGWMRQVILNLAINARDAMGEGGVLTFRTGHRLAEEGGPGALEGVDRGDLWVFLDVEDNGCGMDEATRSRVFEPFFTTKGEGRGTGLGLATVYGLIARLGGLIELESEVGRGTRFRIWLPASAKAADPASPIPAGPAATARRGTLLVVDDEDGVRTLLRRILVRDGHRVLEASHGREAIEVARHHEGPIDVLITDYHMPGLPVSEYLPSLSRRDPGLEVVVVTGTVDTEPARLGLPGTNPRVVRKPFTAGQIQAAVRDALGDGPMRSWGTTSARRGAGHRRSGPGA
jgi:two-component system, cell cycle sensor histidine kinase and response regulator CckA